MRQFLVILLSVFSFSAAYTCDPSITIEGEEKSKYKKNDELIVKVRIVNTHRNCSVDIKNTKFEQEGIKILSATDWKEIEPGIWERKLKIKITANKGQNAKINIIRPCSKGGCNLPYTFPT
jgi:hypothetical protein